MNYPYFELGPTRAVAIYASIGMLCCAENLGKRTGSETTLDKLKAEM